MIREIAGDKRYFSKGELSKLIGVTQGYISQYISLGKVISDKSTGVDSIDIAIPENEHFVLKVYNKNKEKIEAKKNMVPVAKPLGAPKQTTKKKRGSLGVHRREPTQDFESNEPEISGSGSFGLDAEKKRAEIKWKKLQTKKIEMELAKMRGDYIPTELVRNLIMQFSRSIISTYKEGAEAFLIEISHRKKLTIQDESEMKGELISIINKSHDSAIERAKNELTSIVNEYTKNKPTDDTDSE